LRSVIECFLFEGDQQNAISGSVYFDVGRMYQSDAYIDMNRFKEMRSVHCPVPPAKELPLVSSAGQGVRKPTLSFVSACLIEGAGTSGEQRRFLG